MNIAVYAASSGRVAPAFTEAARALGRAMALHGHVLINGAGNQGLMAASANASLKEGGRVIGVIPQFMIDEGWHHTGLSQLIVTASMHERKQRIAAMSHACIALPGGCGTMEELLEIITWKQLGLYTMPIVILNTNGYYNPLLQQLRSALDSQFMASLHAQLWCVASEAEEAVRLCEETPRWDSSLKKMAYLT